MWTWRAWTGALVSTAVSIGTALAADDGPARTEPSALAGSSLTWCGDLEPIRAAPEADRDAPVYAGNEQPEDVITWARQQPGFVDVWIDRENLGWLTLTFSRGADGVRDGPAACAT